MAAEASGKAFLGVIAYIKAKYGDKVVDEIVATAGESTGELFSEKIALLEWYPYAAFGRLLEAVQARFGKGDPNYCRILGELSGEKDLESTFVVYKSIENPERFIRNCGIIWSRYYRNAGEFVVVSYSPKKTVYHLNDFPEMNVNHCRLLEGWMSTTMKGLGYKVIKIQETQCMHAGAPYHEFVIETE